MLWNHFVVETTSNPSYPKYNIAKIDDEVTELQILVPGWDKEAIQVKFKDNRLKVVAQPIKDSDVKYTTKGFSTKGFDIEFAVNFPAMVNDVTLEKGILKIKIRKDSEEEYEIPIT